MLTHLQFNIHAQPDDVTCGPTCLQAVYRYYGDNLPLKRVIEETPQLEEGGTLAVYLACHALERGYTAKIYTYNLHMFDPTWFAPPLANLREKLQAQMKHKRAPKFRAACQAYIDFIEAGGRILFRDLTPSLIRGYLRQGIPILTGLNATYLYSCARERMVGMRSVYDDVAGDPSGHFVVLHGYNKKTKDIYVADPYALNPAQTQLYPVRVERLLCAIMLGIVTYDANLLIIQPSDAEEED